MSPDPAPLALKLLVAGGFGVGKTTLIGSVSEIAPLKTEALMTQASEPVDDLTGLRHKTHTTVAGDFGRLTLSEPHVALHLFGVPGQPRFWDSWADLASGAIGAIVLADTRRLETSFEAVDYVERLRLPYVVAVNQFDGARWHDLDKVGDALEIDGSIPLMRCDARDQASAEDVVVALLKHHIRRLRAAAEDTQPRPTTGALL